MIYKKILYFFLAILFVPFWATLQDVIDYSESLFVPHTTSPKMYFRVFNNDRNNKTIVPFYAQAGTLVSSGKEGFVVTRLQNTDIAVSTSNVRTYELPEGASKILTIGYTNFPDPFNNGGALIAGTQDATYALLYTFGEGNLAGGINWGWQANMHDLANGYWDEATMHKIFDVEIPGNFSSFSAKGNGLYYIRRGTDTTKIVDIVYRFIINDFAGGINDAHPTPLIISGQHGAPKIITAIEVIVDEANLGQEQLLIGSHEGLYITTVAGGTQQAALTPADITFNLIATEENASVKSIHTDSLGRVIIVVRNNEKRYETYTTTLHITNGDLLPAETLDQPNAAIVSKETSSTLPVVDVIHYLDTVERFRDTDGNNEWTD